MKTSRIVFCLFLGIIYMACNDTIGRVGLDMQPDQSKVNVFDTTIIISARTIQADSVYANTPNGFLGEFYDPSYGNIKSSFICQYYPSMGFPYLDSIFDGVNRDKIDSVRLNLYYSSYIGDTLAPMEVTVYPVIKALDQNYYTNADPTQYCDMNHPLAKYSYTARNMNISDSLSQVFQSNSGYYSYISIPLPVQFGQDYLNKIMAGELKTVDEFLNYFPGTYVTTTYGTGSILPVDLAQIYLYYTLQTSTLTDSNGNNDSTGFVVSSAFFTVTKEIIQLNRFENKNPAFLTATDSTKTYLKTPAGVYTELTIPIKEIVKGIGKKTFSSVAISFKAYPPNDWNYSLQFPGMANSLVPATSGSTGYSAKLLLIQPDSVANFFEMKKFADGQTTYTTQFNPTTYSYDFTNISNLVQNAIDNAPDQDLKLWLIPVQTTWVQQTDAYGNVSSADYTTSNYLYPSGVTLMTGSDNLKVRVIATDLTIKK